MRPTIKTTLLLVFTFLASSAQASLLVEPVLGYNLGSKLQFTDTDDSYTSGRGMSFGGRLGFQKLGFQVGLDYLHSDLDMNDNDFDKNVKMSEWAGFVGFEFPALLRVYAGYIFSASGESAKLGQKIELENGSGAKFGAGFTVLPFLDINLEYRRGTFGKYESAGTSVSDDVNYSSYMLGISLPVNL